MTEGRDMVDIDIDLQPTAAGAAVRLFELLEEADRMCEASELLTMATPREVEEQPEPFRR